MTARISRKSPSQGQAALSYTDTTVNPSTTYYYRIRATNVDRRFGLRRASDASPRRL